MHTIQAFVRLLPWLHVYYCMIACICLDHDTISKATTVDDEEEIGKKSNVRFCEPVLRYALSTSFFD
jgi:hypothetical protein